MSESLTSTRESTKTKVVFRWRSHSYLSDPRQIQIKTNGNCLKPSVYDYKNSLINSKGLKTTEAFRRKKSLSGQLKIQNWKILREASVLSYAQTLVPKLVLKEWTIKSLWDQKMQDSSHNLVGDFEVAVSFHPF